MNNTACTRLAQETFNLWKYDDKWDGSTFYIGRLGFLDFCYETGIDKKEKLCSYCKNKRETMTNPAGFLYKNMSVSVTKSQRELNT